MGKLFSTVIALQFVIFGTTYFNHTKIADALEQAAAEGKDTFAATQTYDFFGSSKSTFTMVNGWKAVNTPNQCSVNLVRSESGTPVEDTVGLLFDFHPPARRFVIKDCSKLPSRIFDVLVIR